MMRGLRLLEMVELAFGAAVRMFGTLVLLLLVVLT